MREHQHHDSGVNECCAKKPIAPTVVFPWPPCGLPAGFKILIAPNVHNALALGDWTCRTATCEQRASMIMGCCLSPELWLAKTDFRCILFRCSEAEGVAPYAARGQPFFLECWFSRARILQISSPHPASLDPQRPNFAQAS